MSGWMTAGGEIMSVALAEHTGPWTADDIEALPDAGDHARFKVCDGGILVVTPAPGAGHRRASGRLHRALAHAATAARADAEVPGAVNVALPGGKLLVPAVVVVEAGAVAEMATRVPCEAVLAVVEVVSPPTVSIDRAVKPVMYAEAGIPVYWRVEQLQGTPKIVACSLSRGRYVTRTTLVAGTPGRITRPFAVGLDPADLTRRTTRIGAGQARAAPFADLVLGDLQSRHTAASRRPEARCVGRQDYIQ
jgi:Uma2 family endonuclease